MNRLEAVREGLARLQADASANPRLGALLMAIPLVLVCWLALLARDAIETAREERAPLLKRAERLATLASSGEWEAQIRAGEEQLSQWESRAWRAASADLAAADLQTALRGIVSRHLAWNRLKLAPAEEMRALGGWRISAEINGKLRDEGVLPLLQEIAEHRPRIQLVQLQVSSQRGQTVSMQISVIALPEAAP